MFADWPTYKLSQLIPSFEEKKFLPHEVLYKEYDEPEFIYFIRSGEVVVNSQL